MDISIIKTHLEKPEGEQQSSKSDGLDLAFLQLLASLGLTPPLSVDSEAPPTINSGTVTLAPSSSVDQRTLVMTPTTNTLQEQTMTDGKESVEPAQVSAKEQTLIAQAINSVANNESDPIQTDPGQALATVVKNLTVKNQTVAGQGKGDVPATTRADTQGPAESPRQVTTNVESQAVAARLMDAVFSGDAQKEHGPASAVTPASTGVISHAVPPASTNLDAPGKQTITTTPAVMWSTVMESSTLAQSGTNDHSAAEHEGWKEQLTSGETNGPQSTSSPMTSSFSSQGLPASVRMAPPAVVEAPTVSMPSELPLPATVRFEVQPGDMGRIRVHVSVMDHMVYTNVITERVEAHDFLVRGSERFEAGLAAHGLEVGRFQVDVQGQGRQHADRGGTAWSQDDPQRRPPSFSESEQPILDRHAGDRQGIRMHGMISVFA